MKRFVVTFTILCLLVSCFVVSAAAETAGFSFSADIPAFLEKGSQFEVTVILENCPSVKSMSIQPVYDQSKLKLIEGEWTSGVKKNPAHMISIGWAEAYPDAVAAFATPTQLDDAVFTMTFEVLDFVGDTKIGVESVIKSLDLTTNEEFYVLGNENEAYRSIEDGDSWIVIHVTQTEETETEVAEPETEETEPEGTETETLETDAEESKAESTEQMKEDGENNIVVWAVVALVLIGCGSGFVILQKRRRA